MLGHLISFRPKQQLLVFWKGEAVCELELVGKPADIKFSETAQCIGYAGLDSYSKCPHNSKGYKQCFKCRDRDISKIYTRLDFTGFEELKDEYVKQDFSLYMASFGDSIVKCGVTRTERLEERTHEQGADYWAEVMRFDDGEEAYATEVALQQKFNLCNAVRHDTKLALLNKPKSQKMLEEKIREMKSCIDFQGKLLDCEIRENVYPVPESFEIAYAIDGLVTGSKCGMLFFEKEGRHFVIQMNRMEGRAFMMRE